MSVLILCSALCICRFAAGQNSNVTAASIFAAPSLQLRPCAQDARQILEVKNEKTPPSQEGMLTVAAGEPSSLRIAEVKNSPALELSSSGRWSKHEIEIYRRLDEAGYLTRPEPETPLGHFMNSTFTPEVIHLGRGKAFAEFTLYTAIKRKNPLCLLNPLVFFASW